MAKVIPGRFTAQTDEAFVVFIIGTFPPSNIAKLRVVVSVDRTNQQLPRHRCR
jgi:hypothetical protein